MNTDAHMQIAKARAAGEAARRRRARLAEFEAFCSGGALVFAGLLLAAAYCLLTHQIRV